MLVEPTLQQLYKMRLNGMAEAFVQRMQDPAMEQLAFEDRFGMLVESQWTWKESRALTRRLSLARLKQQACMEDVNFRHPRGLDVARWKGMAHESAWVRRKLNVILCGPTGIGKSFLCCVLLQQACRDGFSVLHTRATPGRRNCSATCGLRGPRARWRSWRAWMPWRWTISRWRRWTSTPAGTSWTSVTTAA